MHQQHARLHRLALIVLLLCASTGAFAQRRFGPGVGGSFGSRAGGVQMSPGTGGYFNPALRGGFADPRVGAGFGAGYPGRTWVGRPAGGWYGNRGWSGYPYRGGYWGGYPGLWLGGLGLGLGAGYGYPYGGYGSVYDEPDVGETGAYCATPVRTCLLINPSYVGGGCSCRITGGRARGAVVP